MRTINNIVIHSEADFDNQLANAVALAEVRIAFRRQVGLQSQDGESALMRVVDAR